MSELDEQKPLDTPGDIDSQSVAEVQPSFDRAAVSLRKKLRLSVIGNLVLAAALLFVGGSYAALVTGSGELRANAADGNSAGQNQQQGNQAQGNEAQGSDAQPNNQPKVVDAELLKPEPYMILGEDTAPITLYEWTDFTCPYCGVFNRETLPEIITEYVDKGLVRIELHDVTYIGPQAEDAAVAARAAGLQGHYFDYLFAVYELGENNNRPDLSKETLFELATTLDLDMTKFESDFSASQLREQVVASTGLAQSLGVSAVPFFVAASTGTLEGLQDIRGAQPLDEFKAVLDAQLARVQG